MLDVAALLGGALALGGGLAAVEAGRRIVFRQRLRWLLAEHRVECSSRPTDLENELTTLSRDSAQLGATLSREYLHLLEASPATLQQCQQQWRGVMRPDVRPTAASYYSGSAVSPRQRPLVRFSASGRPVLTRVDPRLCIRVGEGEGPGAASALL